jgi:hypothetical protein
MTTDRVSVVTPSCPRNSARLQRYAIFSTLKEFPRGFRFVLKGCLCPQASRNPGFRTGAFLPSF